MTPAGIDAGGVTSWFTRHVEDVEPPLQFVPFPGGRSNLTFQVTDAGGRRWALRRPPLSQVLQSAHDVVREYRIMAALAPTEVPVPAVVGLCEDARVTGAPFVVMDVVDGTVLRDGDAVRAALPEAARPAATEQLVDGLVALHAVDPERVGLGQLGRRDNYLQRQLSRWARQLDRLGGHPALERLHRMLVASLPAVSEGGAIVHGDYRLANTVTGPDGTLRAVLDWELCTLGDPLADVGWLLVYWRPPEGIALPALSMPTTASGFPGPDAVAHRYAERSGRSVDSIGYHVAFAYWRLAVILFGVRHRIREGAYGEPTPEAVAFDDTIAGLSTAAAAAVERHRQ